MFKKEENLFSGRKNMSNVIFYLGHLGIENSENTSMPVLKHQETFMIMSRDANCVNPVLRPKYRVYIK